MNGRQHKITSHWQLCPRLLNVFIVLEIYILKIRNNVEIIYDYNNPINAHIETSIELNANVFLQSWEVFWPTSSWNDFQWSGHKNFRCKCWAFNFSVNGAPKRIQAWVTLHYIYASSSFKLHCLLIESKFLSY